MPPSRHRLVWPIGGGKRHPSVHHNCAPTGFCILLADDRERLRGARRSHVQIL